MLQDAARDIEDSIAPQDDGFAGPHGDVATCGGQLGDIALDDIENAGQVTERCPNPVAPEVIAGLLQIDRKIDSTDTRFTE